jgi:hypothetical protein
MADVIFKFAIPLGQFRANDVNPGWRIAPGRRRVGDRLAEDEFMGHDVRPPSSERAPRGHVGAPPSAAMNSRRLTRRIDIELPVR